jgi:hypothetical protein
MQKNEMRTTKRIKNKEEMNVQIVAKTRGAGGGERKPTLRRRHVFVFLFLPQNPTDDFWVIKF